MKRLETLASLVDKDAKVVDIGTDHAYLPIYLYQNNVTHNIIASDVSKNVLEYSKKNLQRNDLENKIKLVLSDGFLNIEDEYDTAIISGLGFNTIKKILEHQSLPNTLIISSHSDIINLRKYMASINYKIAKEIYYFEKNRYYVMIKYIKGYEKLTDEEILLGKESDKNYQKYLLLKYQELYTKSQNKIYLNYIKIIERKLDL